MSYNNFNYPGLPNDYMNQLRRLQQEYSSKMDELRNGFNASIQNQFNPPPVNPNLPPPAGMSPAAQPEGSIPPHMQIIAAIGDIKGELAAIKDALTKKEDTVSPVIEEKAPADNEKKPVIQGEGTKVNTSKPKQNEESKA
ncbi:hypothetical protein IR083_20880 [Dysgonomonas sp. GY75]|uniref:hypothetical protein n=1 Tax=Dysgonomonas sp. GY75 TaxID=2780419 RepID=UPI00188371A4|nr:hypothetical protein [Dysgonomonas sp. GY75]MBF0651277.1 hypothetical protein [Dysgonomonas sp. GY75]